MKKKEIVLLEEIIMASPFRDIQKLINGDGWMHKSEYIRQLIKEHLQAGICMLGNEPTIDRNGSIVPSRHQVKAGTMGSPDYVADRLDELVVASQAILN